MGKIPARIKIKYLIEDLIHYDIHQLILDLLDSYEYDPTIEEINDIKEKINNILI